MPTGPHLHIVRSGDCMESIAAEHGCDWRALWNHPRNAALKQARGNPNVLAAGDVVYIPNDAAPGRLSLRVGEANRFRGDLPLTTLKVRLQRREGEQRRALAGVPFRVLAGGASVSGTTTSDGDVEASVPATARFARIELHPGTDDERVVEVRIGDLDPHDTPSGHVHRLANLGYLPSSASPQTQTAAIRRFQVEHGLEPTGELDAETEQRLRDEHDGEP